MISQKKKKKKEINRKGFPGLIKYFDLDRDPRSGARWLEHRCTLA